MKMLIVMTMMMFVQVAVAEEEVKYPRVWLLVMVDGDGDMVEWKRYGLWSSCVSKGTAEMKRHLEVAGEEGNPYRYNGFFCEKDVPEPVTMLMPKCLSPMKECA